MRIATPSFVVAALALVACGGDVFSGSDGGPGGDGGPGPDVNASDGGGLLCPASKPASGTSCAPVGLECEYGSDPNANCNPLARCTASGWIDVTEGKTCPPPGTLCPPTYASVPVNQDCAPDGEECPYPQGECFCTRGGGGAERLVPAWSCAMPAAGCPSMRPHLGASCSSSDLVCDYGSCLGGVAVVCKGGYWQRQITACAL